MFINAILLNSSEPFQNPNVWLLYVYRRVPRAESLVCYVCHDESEHCREQVTSADYISTAPCDTACFVRKQNGRKLRHLLFVLVLSYAMSSRRLPSASHLNIESVTACHWKDSPAGSSYTQSHNRVKVPLPILCRNLDPSVYKLEYHYYWHAFHTNLIKESIGAVLTGGCQPNSNMTITGARGSPILEMTLSGVSATPVCVTGRPWDRCQRGATLRPRPPFWNPSPN